MKFIFTRHTTTTWNLTKKIQGWSETDLTEQGIKEANELALALSKFKISHIISSSLKRAKQTAYIINDLIQKPLFIEGGLKECCFGCLEGMTKKETINKFGESILKDWEDQYLKYDFTRFGGENQKGVLKRHLEVLKKYKNYSTDKNSMMLVVGHGRGLATLLYYFSSPLLLKRGEYRIIEYK